MLHARYLPSPTYTNPSSPSESFEHANDPAERDGGVFVGEGRGLYMVYLSWSSIHGMENALASSSCVRQTVTTSACGLIHRLRPDSGHPVYRMTLRICPERE
jgi:hypothetical protein